MPRALELISFFFLGHGPTYPISDLSGSAITGGNCMCNCVVVYSPNQRKNALVGCSERPNGHLSLLHLRKHCIYA